jgi:hypothetical protein
MSDLKSRLESHPVTVLKKEISKTNVKGYSKMKKAEVVSLMLKHKDRFDHIKHKSDSQKQEPKEEPKKKKIIKVKRKKDPEPFKLEPDEFYLRIKEMDNKTSVIKAGKDIKSATKKFTDRRSDRKNKNYKQMTLFKGDNPKKALEFSG